MLKFIFNKGWLCQAIEKLQIFTKKSSLKYRGWRFVKSIKMTIDELFDFVQTY